MVCVVTGWGSIDPEGEVWGPVLKQDYAQLYSNQECGEVMGQPDWITDRMLCAGEEGGVELPRRHFTMPGEVLRTMHTLQTHICNCASV